MTALLIVACVGLVVHSAHLWQARVDRLVRADVASMRRHERSRQALR